MTTIDASVASLVTRLGRSAASGMDVPAVLGGVCASLPGTIGVAGAVIMLAGRGDGAVGACYPSDDRAGWIGEVQRRAGSGPLPGSLRSGRPLLTPDMVRIGPPELAVTAAEYGLTSSMVLPMEMRGERVGALQLLGDARLPVEMRHADLVRDLVEVLAARLVDARALAALAERAAAAETEAAGRAHRGPAPVDRDELDTAAIPVVPSPPRAVPSPRPPQHGSRHSLGAAHVNRSPSPRGRRSGG